MPIDYKPHIGKTVIETLTMGMYEDPLIIYREYVQNAADQIDIAFEEGILKKKSDGKISISVNNAAKSIEVSDNATGITAKSVLSFLGDVANSEKDETERKGFRGIGRLGGLGYCEKLIFKTSARGENIQSIMTLDAKMLKRLLLNRDEKMDAATVISVITDVTTKKEILDRHYFVVIMENVTNSALLNIETVRNYLKMVAPVPFNPKFTFADEIEQHFSKNNIIFDEYNVEVNSERLFKGYNNKIVEENETSTIVGIDYFAIRSRSRSLLALGWVGYRDLSNIVLGDQVVEKGIRIRKNNIQIGSNTTLNRFFPASRTNQRFVGELHVLGPGFIPNARRDYFIDNATCSEFETLLIEVLKNAKYENIIAHTASLISTRIATIEKYREDANNLQTKMGKFRSTAEETAETEKVNLSKEKAEKASKELQKLKGKSKEDRRVQNLYTNLTAGKRLDIPGFNLRPTIYDPPQFKKLKPSEVEIVKIIFSIIEKELDVEDSENLKRKIIEKFN